MNLFYEFISHLAVRSFVLAPGHNAIIVKKNGTNYDKSLSLVLF